MDTSLPNWWVINKTGATNYGYPQLGGSRANANFVRIRFRLPLGFNKPNLIQVTDPSTEDLRIHTAWDKSYAICFGGNHVDVPVILRQENPPNGMWDLFGELDIPIDTSDPFDYQAYLARFINAWVMFPPFEGVQNIQVVMWQVRTGAREFLGIEREDLPSSP